MRTNYNSRYKIHNQELSAKDVMQKKKEKILNNVEENDDEYNNDLKKKGNQVVSVSNYSTYLSITKPKYNHTFSSEILSGHNVFKYVNENGKLCDKNRTLTVNKQCVTSSIQEEVFLNETYDDMTNYLDDDDAQLIDDMILNEIIENERSKVTFSLVFNDVQNIEDVDNDGSRNDIIDSIYLVVNSNLNDVQISKSDIRIIDIRFGSVIVDVEIINRIIDDTNDNAYYSQQIINTITTQDIYPNTSIINQTIINNNTTTYNPIASSFDISLNEDTSCNIDLSGSYGGTGTIQYRIQTLPSGELFKTDDNGLFVLLNDQSIDTLIDSDLFRYVPINNYYGQDSFTYSVLVDSLQSTTATVNITIHGVNDEPDTSNCDISGECKQGSIIIANVSVTDDDNLTNSRNSQIAYQWQFADYMSSVFTDIVGANDASYQIPDTKQYVNKYIRVVYTATDDGGTDISYVSDASYVQNVNHPCEVNSIEILNINGNDVTISSTHSPTEGNRLDVSFTITDVDVDPFNDLTKYSTTPSFNYQWYRSDSSVNKPGTLIDNATDSSYTLVYDDISKYIYVEISYYDDYTNEEFDSSFTNQVQSHGNHDIYFNPSTDLNPINLTIDSFASYNLPSVIDRFNDHNDISYRILARNEQDYWSDNYFNDLSGFQGWSLNTTTLQITVSPNYDTFLDQSNNWGIYIELRLEAYSISSPDISAIYTLKYQINNANAPSWDWGGHPNSTLSDISQGSYFQFDLSVNITGVADPGDLDADLSINLSTNATWISLDTFTYPNVKVTGTPSNEHVGDVSFTLTATYGTKLPVSEIFSFDVNNIDDTPSPIFINIMRNEIVLDTTDDICQNDVLDMSFTIKDIDVSTNPFNQNNINNFFDSSDKYQYQWYRDSSSISGATGLSYTLVEVDVSCEIWVDISYTDEYGFSFDISSSKYGPVYNVNDGPTSNISFTVNDAIHNQNNSIYEYDVIVASFTITDTDLSSNSFNQNNIDEFFSSSDKYDYQWYRDSSAITSATDLSYTLTSDDISSNIWFKILYTDKYNTTEDISKSVSTTVVLNYDTSSNLYITLSYEHLMIGYEISGTLNWSRIDEDGIASCEYQFQKGTSIADSIIYDEDSLETWQTIPIADISTVTNYNVSIILPDDTVNFYIRLLVKVQDAYGSPPEYFDAITSTIVSDWSYTGSSSFFFRRNGRVVNSTVESCGAASFIFLTGEQIGDSGITTDASGQIDLSFSRPPTRYLNYNDFLIVTNFSNGNVRVIEETGDTIIQNRDFFYKVFRVYTYMTPSGDPVRDISDTVARSDIISLGAINSACNAVIFELTLQDFWDDFSANNPDLSINTLSSSTTFSASGVLLSDIWDPSADIPSTPGSINFTDLRPYFGDVSNDYILESCADFVMGKIEEKQNIVINALGISNEEIDKNPYDIIKMEAFHTISTSIVNSVLSRNYDANNNIISVEDKETLCKNIYRKILHYLEPENLDISFSISNKDSVTNYISEVISDISHYDTHIDDNPTEMTEFRSFMDDILKPYLMNVGREMVDDTFDTYLDDSGYISTIQKSRLLISGVNLRTIDLSNSQTTNITLLKVSQELTLVRDFNIPTDVIVFLTPHHFKIKYYLTQDDSKSIYMKPVDSGKHRVQNFAIWYQERGILMDDIEDYPSLTHYSIFLEENVYYHFQTYNEFIHFEDENYSYITPYGSDANKSGDPGRSDVFSQNPLMVFSKGEAIVSSLIYESLPTTRTFYVIDNPGTTPPAPPPAPPPEPEPEPEPFAIGPYYPLYYTEASAIAASPYNTANSYTINGQLYYMPDGIHGSGTGSGGGSGGGSSGTGPLFIAGYYPLYNSGGEAANASPDNTVVTHYIHGQVYYMPGGVVPFSIAGYYPLYNSGGEAANASPDNTVHSHTLNGQVYYMPDGVTYYHGNFYG